MSLRAILWVFDESDATLGRRLVLLGLAEYAHEDGTKAFPTVATLARKVRMSRKAVQSALRKLEEDREIVCTGQTKSGTNVYTLIGVAAAYNDLGERVEVGGVASMPRGAQSASVGGAASTPDPKTYPKTELDSFATTWGKHAPPLRRHGASYFQSPRFRTALNAALRTYELPDVLKAIENYATVQASAQHYFDWLYSAVDFCSRPRATPGVEHFVDEAQPLTNFRVRRDADAKGERQRTPVEQLQSAEAWILATAWRLPLDEYEVAEQLGQRGVEGPDRTRLLDLWRSKRAA